MIRRGWIVPGILVAAALLCLTTAACQEEEPAGHDPEIRSEQGILKDSLGRQVLLRGINARVEGLFDVTFDDGRTPLETIPPFTRADCRFLARSLGFNLLRLPVNWSGIEPQKGKYSEAYFKKIEAVVSACHAEGVHTIIDLHQDAWSKEIGEDGAPLWAIVPPPTKLLQGPLKDLDQRRLSVQVLAAFASFFDDKENLQQAYADMAASLVHRLQSQPGLVGLELMNEPVLFTGDSKLDAFHLKVGQALRKGQPRLCLFFEPNSLRNMTDGAPVGTPYPLGNSVYSPHIYTGVFLGNWKSGDTARIRLSVLKASQEAAAHKAALFIGEFGHNPKSALGQEWLRGALAQFDEVQASWAIWLYEEYSQGSWGLYEAGSSHTRGKLRKKFAEIIARPFPTRLAGRLAKMSWDAASRTLTVSLTQPMALKHEFSIPSLTYPSGAVVSCDGQQTAVVKPLSGRAIFSCPGSSISISPP